jgi:uncharacterized membrane protein
MRVTQADVPVTAAVTVLTCAAAAAGAPVPVTTVLGLALLAAPGYLWVQVLLGPSVTGLERLVVAAGLALCVPIFGGLVLYAAGVPLHRAGWLTLLAIVTLAGDVAVLIRRRGRESAGRTTTRRRVPTRHLLTFGAAIVIGIGAVAVARIGAAVQHYPGFTQLWLAEQSNNPGIASLGVGNHEGKTVRYRLVLLRGKHVTNSWNLTLANGQVWRAEPVVGGATWTADLYRLPDLARPYRYVEIVGGGGS